MGNNENGCLGTSKPNIKKSLNPCLVEKLSKFKAIDVSCGYAHTGVVLGIPQFINPLHFK